MAGVPETAGKDTFTSVVLIGIVRNVENLEFRICVNKQTIFGGSKVIYSHEITYLIRITDFSKMTTFEKCGVYRC